MSNEEIMKTRRTSAERHFTSSAIMTEQDGYICKAREREREREREGERQGMKRFMEKFERREEKKKKL